MRNFVIVVIALLVIFYFWKRSSLSVPASDPLNPLLVNNNKNAVPSGINIGTTPYVGRNSKRGANNYGAGKILSDREAEKIAPKLN